MGLEEEAIERAVPRLLRVYRVPGCSVACVRAGRLAWSGSYGTVDETTGPPPRRHGGRGAAVGPGTCFQVASLSKVVTAWTAMTVVADGLVGLDDPVGPLLQRWSFPKTAHWTELVTLRGLLSHTAGLPSAASPVYHSPEEVPALTDVVSGTAGTPSAVPDRPPGQAFRYSNPGYALVQLLVEDLTDTAFAAYAAARVLGPLVMTSSSFDPANGAGVQPAAPHRRTGKRLPNGYFNQQAAGGLLTTADDLALLCIAMMETAAGRGGRVLESAAVEEMWKCPTAAIGAYRLRDGGYALGQVTGTLPSGTRFVANQGSRPGWRALMICLPDQGNALVVTTNSNSGLALLAHLTRRWLRRVAHERLPRIRLL
ncbi:MAG: serine hydrolase domain-containing protein [Acidimicrobiales bacterium]